jgi:WD40 repeat protein
MRHTTYVGPNVMYSENLHNRLLVDMLRSLVITHSQRFFDRRVERVVWSPRSRSTLAVGSHGGDVYLWNYENELRTSKIVDGCGKGGAINDMKFSQEGHRTYSYTDRHTYIIQTHIRMYVRMDGCGKGGAINDMKFSQEGDRLFTVGHDGDITAHDTETAVAVHSFATKSFGSVPKPGNCCDHW